ncbi:MULTISPECIES: helix-turn-helix domain-containing protein [unclassified Streptomyces]|uniref:AraC-like ligand-binding domain-containing protein n=1 Tax=unclassified Streptomyces TaxID=2593676 RepID=UPI00380EAB9F
MRETVFRSDEIPRAGRFDGLRERMITLDAPRDISTDRVDGFSADMRFLQLGSVCVWPATMRSLRMRRTPGLIRQGDPEHYHVTLLLQGTKGIVQQGREAVLSPYQLHVVDTSRPYLAHMGGPEEDARVIGVELPKALLPLPLDKVDRLVARSLQGREGVGALFTTFLTRLVQDAGSYRPTDSPRLETVLTNLFAALLAHELDTEDALPPETRRQTLTLSIRAFIRQHLHDPALTPDAVAAAHHISASYLHRLFQGQHHTVSSLIRRERLEHARRDLADPALRDEPVHRIGARWGFTHHAVFTRAFSSLYGLPPRDYRRQALGA